MNYTKGLVTGIGLSVLCVATLWGGWWLLGAQPQSDKPGVSTAPPFVLEKPVKEDQLNTITLTPDAVARLDLQTAAIQRQPMPRLRVYGGEVIVPPGRTALVTAPVNGTLQAVPGSLPQPGATVEKGRPLFQLLPILTPEGRANLTSSKIDAEGQLKAAETQQQAARIALGRAQRVLKGEAGSQRAVDDAQALYDLAQKAVEAAAARVAVLDQIVGEVEAGRAGPISIDAPATGMLRALSAMPGQDVHAGAALFEIVDLSRIWVRVPVYAGDAHNLDLDAKATVAEQLAERGAEPVWATPVAAPPSANALNSTVDVYYEIDQDAANYRPGQRIAMGLSLKTEAESLVCPWSAVIYDIYGGGWVYVARSELAYTRERVIVHHVTGDKAVLASGPPVGTQVVVAGAAELFGAETGYSK